MTPLDLRIKYKSETGFAPTYGRYPLTHGNTQSGCNYQGNLTRKYAEWLEGNNTKKRDAFHHDIGLIATYYDANHFLHYTSRYKEWLEEQKCKAFSILELLK